MPHYRSKPFNPNYLITLIKKMTTNNEPLQVNELKEEILFQQIGMSNIGGDFEFYKIVLQEFFNENDDTKSHLEKMIEEDRFIEASQIVRKIKGSSGSIGAKQVYELSVEFQKALTNEDREEIAKIKDEYLAQLNSLFDEIELVINQQVHDESKGAHL